jgi:hypothetical protein
VLRVEQDARLPLHAAIAIPIRLHYIRVCLTDCIHQLVRQKEKEVGRGESEQGN